MQETNVVELRKRIKHYFDAVESGEVATASLSPKSCR